jgi:hypothetical protein
MPGRYWKRLGHITSSFHLDRLPQAAVAPGAIDTDAIKADGRVYGGGLFKMKPKELAAIPAEFLLAALGIDAGAVVGERQGRLFADG